MTLRSGKFIGAVHSLLILTLQLREHTADAMSSLRSLSCALAEQGMYQRYTNELQDLINMVYTWITALEYNENLMSSWFDIIINLPIDLNDQAALQFWKIEFPDLAEQIISNSSDNLRLVEEL